MLNRLLITVIFIEIYVHCNVSIKTKSEVDSQKYDPYKIWSRFNATNANGSEVVEYQIRNIPNTRFEEAMHLMQQFLEDEALNKILDITITNHHIQRSREYWKLLLHKNMSVGCFDDDDKMAGVVLMYIGKRIGSKSKRGKITQISMDLMDVDIFEIYRVDEYLANKGVVVQREYRRRGIAKQLLVITKDICAEYRLEVAASVITSPTIDKIAADLGFQLDVSDRLSDDLIVNLRSIKYKHK
ncbi:uncharacterized protein LOC116343351 [Contarinia nasturtii]|uniref:uncharacterized protein LOC116343351 n=1 Tax=Contarinia nasturtii TaxID=265458 RepID=UPI0012D42324|nr:uncharacterized protein LOC116343351 [Contarinia nasturtii]